MTEPEDPQPIEEFASGPWDYFPAPSGCIFDGATGGEMPCTRARELLDRNYFGYGTPWAAQFRDETRGFSSDGIGGSWNRVYERKSRSETRRRGQLNFFLPERNDSDYVGQTEVPTLVPWETLIGGGSWEPGLSDDCATFADEVERLANNSSTAEEFLKKMVDRFIGNEGFDVSSEDDFEKANRTGNREFGATGFKSQFKDSSNQVRHFTGGLWAGFLFGSVAGKYGMNANESNTFGTGRGAVSSGLGIIPSFFPTEDAKADIALNAISTNLGSKLTPTTGISSIKAGYSTPDNPGFKDLANQIRKQVCE